MQLDHSHTSAIWRSLWRHRRFILWGSLPVILGGEVLFWWLGVRHGQWGLSGGSRYFALQNEHVVGLARVAANFRHFFLFWQKPPDMNVCRNLYELWLSDGSSPWRNLMHVVVFGGTPCVLVRVCKIRALETILWLAVLNITREYVSEGWRLEPSFSDLWVDTICALICTWIACRCFRTRVESTAPKVEDFSKAGV